MKPLQALLALFAFAFLPLHAASLDDLTYETTDGEVAITNCDTAATGELVIPNTIEGNPVTSIGDDAFLRCTSLKSITIPDGVKSIGIAAFYGCSSLTSITIPNSVTNIGSSAFYQCTSLTSITIPDSVTSIEAYAFFSCTSLTSVIFQGVAPTVGSNAFSNTPDGAAALVTIEALSSFGESGDNWNGLTVDTILKWTTTNEEVSINNCETEATGELIIPDTIEGKPVTNIGNQAFFGCTNLTSITIPDSVTSIGNFAFYKCSSLTSITIPDGVTLIGAHAFRDCTSLTSITIPDSVASIGDYAFVNCTSLTSVSIGNGVTSIGDAAFFSCTSLTNITFMGAAPTVGANAFLNVRDGAVALVTIEALSSFGESGDNWNGLTLFTTPQLLALLAQKDAQIAQLEKRPTQSAYDTVVSDRDARPTQTSYNTVVAERNARFTEDQIRTMSVDHTVGQNEAGKMQVKIAFIQSTNLNTYTPFTVIPDSLSVVDGKICMEFPPSDAENFFFRFRIE